MAKRKGEGPYDKDRDDKGEPPKHKPEGREHEVHKEILDRRMRGGRTPTQKDYEDALEQWKNLPGSVVRPPTDVRPPSEEPPKPTNDDATGEEEKS